MKQQRYTGKGIGVALLDTGIYPHMDFDDRITGFCDFISHKKQIYEEAELLPTENTKVWLRSVHWWH